MRSSPPSEATAGSRSSPMADSDVVELSAENERLREALAAAEREIADSGRQLELYAADLRETFKSERARAQQLSRSYKATVRALSNAVEARDAYTSQHAERVTRYAIEIGRRLGLARPTRPRSNAAFCCTTSARSRFRTRSCSNPAR